MFGLAAVRPTSAFAAKREEVVTFWLRSTERSMLVAGMVLLPEAIVGQAPDQTDMKIVHHQIRLDQNEHGAGCDVGRNC